MKHVLHKSTMAVVGLMLFATTIKAQTLNMHRWIELTVAAGQRIQLNMAADTAQTPIRIESGLEVRDMVIDATETGYINCLAQEETIKVYGNVKLFDCKGNGMNLTGLDVSNNAQLATLKCHDNSLHSLNIMGGMQLKELYCQNNSLRSLDVLSLKQLKTLYCFGNHFSVTRLDSIYCQLQPREPNDSAVIVVVENPLSADYANMMLTNAQNLADKNWKLKYHKYETDIRTNGKYACGTKPVNMSQWIELTVTQGHQITLWFKATKANTPIRITNGTTDTTIIVGETWMQITSMELMAQAGSMKIYGDLSLLDCSRNGKGLTALDLSHNTTLQDLFCRQNALTALNLTGSKCLTQLDCEQNHLTTLNFNGLLSLHFISCYGNRFSPQALNEIYCSLPQKESQGYSTIKPIFDDSSDNLALIMTTDVRNAKAKNWEVKYESSNTNIPESEKRFDCSNVGINAISVRLYPNPVRDELTVESLETIETLQLFDITGKELLTQYPNQKIQTIDLSTLHCGIYFLKLRTTNGTSEQKVVKD